MSFTGSYTEVHRKARKRCCYHFSVCLCSSGTGFVFMIKAGPAYEQAGARSADSSFLKLGGGMLLLENGVCLIKISPTCRELLMYILDLMECCW